MSGAERSHHGRKRRKTGAQGFWASSGQTLSLAPKADAAGFSVSPVKRLGLEGAPWLLARVPQEVQVGRLDLPKAGSAGGASPQSRGAQECVEEHGGGHHIWAVLLGQEVELGDLAGRGLLGPEA